MEEGLAHSEFTDKNRSKNGIQKKEQQMEKIDSYERFVFAVKKSGVLPNHLNKTQTTRVVQLLVQKFYLDSYFY